MNPATRKLTVFIAVICIVLPLAGCDGDSPDTAGTLGGVTTTSITRVVPATGPLRVSNINPRYFTDGSGRAIYLTGSHTWNNIQDMSGDKPLPDGFSGYLDWLQSHNHNFIRLWMVEH